MRKALLDIWTDQTSVLFTSYWGWRPHEWATVGWTGQRGYTRREHLLQDLTDPFITVVYVTRNPDGFDRDLVGKLAGFYLMSHEKGHRNDFTHPVHHARNPEKWEHSLRALRAFSYICDPLPIAKEVIPKISDGSARSIAGSGLVLEDKQQIERLRTFPWQEVAMYQSGTPVELSEDKIHDSGMVQAGPIATTSYEVSPSAKLLHRRLYVLLLKGNTSAFLGKPAGDQLIYKIGLSHSPGNRRRTLQKAMPRGAFVWETFWISPEDLNLTAEAAVAGENAMKHFLAECKGHLVGEFYLVSQAQIKKAWQCGLEAAQSFTGNQ